MNEATNKITLVTVCDNNFAVMLTVLIKSIEINHKTNESIDLYIVEDNIKSKNKLKLIASIDHKKINVIWLDMADLLPKDISLPLDRSNFPLNVYLRILIPHFLPQSCEKAIYLDVDMVVRKDISLLWNTAINEKIIAGVVDRSEKVSSTWGGITNFKELGIHPDTKYFNSGLLIMDLKKWRKTELSLEILKCIAKYKEYANFPDQYGLNVIFANQWFELDQRWNTYSPSNEQNPYIIHFIGTKPIYSSYDSNLNYKKEFFHYLSLTKWADFKPKTEYNRLFNKILNRIKKKLKTYIKS
ncbi:lipopolysaccharide biosynthesis glycosyltransferase [Pedobacter sp. CG_S7]|uniref:glycosyltransferase family 8 protein n=1 Tax=Pedobacter sp. CG_S7 TaxID=3143930 RepID=UPI003390EC8A